MSIYESLSSAKRAIYSHYREYRSYRGYDEDSYLFLKWFSRARLLDTSPFFGNYSLWRFLYWEKNCTFYTGPNLSHYHPHQYHAVC